MKETRSALNFFPLRLHLETSTSQVNWNKQYNKEAKSKRTIVGLKLTSQTPLVFVVITALWTFAAKYSLTILGDLLNLASEQFSMLRKWKKLVSISFDIIDMLLIYKFSKVFMLFWTPSKTFNILSLQCYTSDQFSVAIIVVAFFNF